MVSDSETQPPQLAIIEPGRHGARLRISGPAATTAEQARKPRTPRKNLQDADPAGPADTEAEAPHPLLRFTTEDLRVELARRQRQVEYLRLQHGALLRQVAELEAQIARLSPSGRSPAARAPRATRRAPPSANPTSLADALADAVPVGETITPAQAAERALAAGYKSNAQRFGVLVATALAKDERFERLGRGRYRRTR